MTATTVSPATTNACLLTPADAEEHARLALPPTVERFVNGAAGTGLTLRANREALDRVCLVPRVLTDVSSPVTAGRLLGVDAKMPVAVAPMAYQRAVHEDGELATAGAARDLGVPFTVSMFSSHSVEEIAAVGATMWFQVYWLRDRGRTVELLRRAEAAGCVAVMLTVDTPRMGRRLDDLRAGFSLPDGVKAAHFRDLSGPGPGDPTPGVSEVAAQTAALVDPSLSWSDIEWLREQTRLPLILKGVLDPLDARRAVRHGVDAVVVSNHGGRQLDGAVASVDALPAVAEAADGCCEVLLDSGVRSGTDIIKAVALGATGVLLGRPVLWGLAAGGGEGAKHVLRLVQEELEHALALAGCPDLGAASRLRTVTADGRTGAVLERARGDMVGAR
ncbi:alpha-hydroxy acid oxidase [Streptomyces fagopyri]|uniref:alpha-hydroxy acid oxidase n=1 Tax=Streptomyces fagopyri TaxID=2662397 RepID=UPI001D173E92|nr:alpha-hydroxy acid oxidase [Streptomyces fagopyri]